MNKVFNFCAGPAMLPADVMKQAQDELLNWQGQGCSVMEISHRSEAFIEVAEQAERDLRELLNIPENYKVLFTHGGGRGQFAAVPLNLSRLGDSADHLVTGSWSKGAVEEASKYVKANVVAHSGMHNGYMSVPGQEQWQLNANAAYFHYCPNETVEGIAFDWIPQTGGVPIVADLSSTILSQPLDVSNFGLIYAGAQKNIGPSGLSVVIVREDLLGRSRIETPSIFDYTILAKYGSMYNTPPTFAWYLAGLVFKWLKQQGGLSVIAQRNKQKANLLYQCIDDSEFYTNNVAKDYRSAMNVSFHLQDAKLDAAFLSEAESAGLKALKGHRIVGGMRASIYNAMPVEGVRTLVDFMQNFAARNG
jgi:phosphoserine aminotransferase